MDDRKDWMLEGARTFPLWDAVDAEDDTWGYDPNFKRLKCPVCGDTYQHVGIPQSVSSNDNYEAGWGGRGQLDILPVEGECGHKWEMCFGFHKGETATFVRVKEGWSKVSKRKLSKSDYAAVNRGRPVVSYPPGSNRAEIRFGGKPSRAGASRRKGR